MGLGGNTSFKSDMFKIKKARSPFTGPGDIVVSYGAVVNKKYKSIFFYSQVVIRGEYIGPSHKGVGAFRS
jgi:hypothetical protein